MGEFKGILFTLKKRMQSIQSDDSAFYKYLILGYYDGLDINLVDKWYDFRPKGLKERNLQVDLCTPYIDQYTIRAIIPENKEILQKRGFSYDFWENVGSKSIEDYNELKEEARKKYPFMTMSVLNLSEEYVKAQKNLRKMQDGLTVALEDSIKQAGVPMEELHCAIFPSIGYSDFILTFLTDDLKKTSKVISNLRGIKFKDSQAVISNCYSVCGLDKSYFMIQNRPLCSDIQVSIRLNLREGIASGEFLGILKKELEKRKGDTLNPDGGETLYEELKSCYYITFGNSDCLFLPDQPLERYLSLHAPGQILNPQDPFFKKYIMAVRTSVRVKGLDAGEEGDGGIGRNRDLSNYVRKFQEFTQGYEKFLDEHNMHIRSSRAIQQIMKNYLNVAQTSHGFDVKYVIGDAFDSLLKDIDVYISKTEGSLHEQQKAVKALEIFKDYIGTFVADLLRSDRPFIEGNTLTHPSIGSATKLIFSYCAILGELTRKFSSENDFIFLVTSGGCDKTEALDIFDFAQVDEDVKKPILLRVPEMSLYDIQGTLYRMIHECMHFEGDRKRKARYRYLISALGNSIAWDITEDEFCEDRLINALQQIKPYFEEEYWESFCISLTSIFSELKKKARDKIAKAFANQDVFVKYEENEEEKYYHVRTMKREILSPEQMAEIFKAKKNTAGKINFREEIYSCFYNADKEWIQRICQKLEEFSRKLMRPERLWTPRHRFQMIEQKYEFQEQHPEIRDQKLECFIKKFFDIFMENYILEDEEIPDYKGPDFAYTGLCSEIIFSMVESFSDCGAIQILGVKPEDFLLSFIYELWDVEAAFPMTIGNVLRLGADFAVAYQMRGGLPEEVKLAVIRKVELRYSQGYQYRNVGEMLSQVNDILKIYQQERYLGIRVELEAYLEECMADKNWYSEELGSLYKKCDFFNKGSIYQVINQIFCYWEHLGEGEKKDEGT